MPLSGCSALHGVNPNLKKKKKYVDAALVVLLSDNLNLITFDLL